jgi:hypothetical protein
MQITEFAFGLQTLFYYLQIASKKPMNGLKRVLLLATIPKGFACGSTVATLVFVKSKLFTTPLQELIFAVKVAEEA